MITSRLLNRPCTLILRSQAETTEDPFGNLLTADPPRVETVCELQQNRRDEAADEGETSDTRWKLFLLPEIKNEDGESVRLTTGDAVEVNDEFYELIGDPWRVRSPFNQRMSHVEATCRRVVGAGDEG
jgi:hypothetical protein